MAGDREQNGRGLCRVDGAMLKIGIVSSPGGHLTEVRCFRSAYGQHRHFYALNDRISLAKDMLGRTYFLTHAERDWRQIVNFWEAFRVLNKERPDVLISTGASPIVPFAILGRLFFGTKIIFVETMTRVEAPSLTGRIMYFLAHRFYYQRQELRRFYPKGSYVGALI